VIDLGVPMRTAIDLGVQVDDMAAPTGAACAWRPPDPYVDGLGGIDRVRWQQGGWGGGTIRDAVDFLSC